jgi:hypothetical protein
LLSPAATASFAGTLAAYGVLRALSTVLDSIHGLPHLYAQVQTQRGMKPAAGTVHTVTVPAQPAAAPPGFKVPPRTTERVHRPAGLPAACIDPLVLCVCAPTRADGGDSVPHPGEVHFH